MIVKRLSVMVAILCFTSSVAFDIERTKWSSYTNFNLETATNHRKLDPIPSISTCKECSEKEGQAWLHSNCQTDPKLHIQQLDFDRLSEHEYCIGLSPNGNTFMPSEWLELTHNSEIASLDHSLCRWFIEFDPSKPTKIKINRSYNQNEDIVITQFFADGTNSTLTSSDMSTCDQEILNFEFEELVSLLVTSKILTNEVGYMVTVSQDFPNSQSSPKDHNSLLYVVMAVILLLLICANVVFCLFIYRRCRKRNLITRRRNKIIERTRQAKLAKITSTMSRMENGEYASISNTYSQTSCVICLENFGQFDKVHLTNECCHIFHSGCLHKWYESSLPSSGLRCPHCSSVTSARSKPRRTTMNVSKTTPLPENVSTDVMVQHHQPILF